MMSIVVACLPALVQPVSRFIRNRKLDKSLASGANTPGNVGYSNMSGSRSKILSSVTESGDKSMADGIWKTSTTRMEAGSRAGSANTDEMELVERGSKQYAGHKGQHSYVTQWSV
jgi:hypothetical protein